MLVEEPTLTSVADSIPSLGEQAPPLLPFVQLTSSRKAIFFTVVLGLVFLVPCGVIQALTNSSVTLNVVGEVRPHPTDAQM